MEGAKEGKVGGTGEAGATKQREEGERWSVGRPVLPFGNEICVRAALKHSDAVQAACAASVSLFMQHVVNKCTKATDFKGFIAFWFYFIQ